MAFMKYARAQVMHPRITGAGWQGIRKQASSAPTASRNLVAQVGEILGETLSPDRYLLTHCSIVASVDVDTVPNVKLGTEKVGSRTVTRKWADYYIKPECAQFVNNNGDSWSREVLMKSFRTFIGAHNFCFAPDTGVLLADGTYKPIEAIEVGDRVVTHTGAVRAVTHKFEREFQGDIHAVKFDRFKKPVLVTGNHPFRGIQTTADPVRPRRGTRSTNVLRYWKDQIVKGLRDEPHSLKGFQAHKAWVRADQMAPGSYVLGPELKNGTKHDPGLAEILGYYVSEGCPLSPTKDIGFVLSFGHHEQHLAERAKCLAYEVFTPTSVTIAPVQTGIQVRVYSPQASRQMVALGGHLAHNKRLSEEVFSWDKESLLRLLAAWLAGDGSYHKGTLRLRGATVSQALAEQMQRVAELCGVKSSVVFEPQKIGGVSGNVVLTVGGEPRVYNVVPRHHVWSVLISKDSVAEVATRAVRWGAPLHAVPAVQKRQELAWWGDCRVHRVASNDVLPYAGKVYNIEVEDDHSYVIERGIAVHNCEHVQIEEQSKGRIIDAVARDIGPSVYVDILVATDRKHTQLVQDIESGKMGTLSMGCSCEHTTCTQCGNVAVDETDLCEHVRYSKLNTFFDARGQRRVIAELCGHSSHGETGGVRFIEASWVAVPAFTGAVMRNILDPGSVSPERAKQFSEVLSAPPAEWGTNILRAASEHRVAQQFDFGADEGGDEGGGGEGGVKPPEKPSSPFADMEDELYTAVKNRVKERLEKELQEQNVEKALGTPTAPNESVIKEAAVAKAALQKFAREAHARSVATLLRVASSDVAFVDGLVEIDRSFGLRVPQSVYRTALTVGATADYISPDEYFRACHKQARRVLSPSELRVAYRIGNLLTRKGSIQPPQPRTPCVSV
jgi:hypothetical protein